MGIFRQKRYPKVVIAPHHKPAWVRAHPAAAIWLLMAIVVVLALLLG